MYCNSWGPTITLRHENLQESEEEESSTKKRKENSVGFQVFTRVFSENYIPPETERTLLEAFRLFDPSNTGKMSVQQLQDLVMTRGEPLPRSEFEELLLLAGLDGTKTFDYTQLVKRLIKGPAGLAIINTR
ncbi:myosin regulatory light chain [Cystoisospora suis]|uniref:Myosin regulatory light chain n=1 Tax=Cystoisospora suis TaxID=483139 RepID=A0A2C6K938_9APIC|nr:myosin regulatory light chain [Cystoisospora suis]